MKKVYVVIVNYNGADDTIKCINSLLKNEKQIDISIIVVDNNSRDDSIKKLRSLKNIILIELDKNVGFAKGNNKGIEYALKHKFDYILLLNNDTVIEKDAVYKLVNVAEKDEIVGITAPRIMYYYDKNKINYCGGHFNWLKGTTIHEYDKEEYHKKMEPFYTEFITGCCMLIKKRVIEDVGMLPEDYFMYYEDADYCLLVKEKGYKLAVNPDSVIYHKVSATSGGENSPFSIKWGNRNRIIFINKYKKYTKGIFTITFFYLSRFIKLIINALQSKRDLNKAIIEGIKDGRKYVKEVIHK